MLAREADIIVRFQGGANAGHTIVNDYGKFALHTLPSGVFYGHTTSIIGNGVALDVPRLFAEVQSVVEKGVPMPKILVSDRAQMVMSYHKNLTHMKKKDSEGNLSVPQSRESLRSIQISMQRSVSRLVSCLMMNF